MQSPVAARNLRPMKCLLRGQLLEYGESGAKLRDARPACTRRASRILQGLSLGNECSRLSSQ